MALSSKLKCVDCWPSARVRWLRVLVFNYFPNYRASFLGGKLFDCSVRLREHIRPMEPPVDKAVALIFKIPSYGQKQSACASKREAQALFSLFDDCAAATRDYRVEYEILSRWQEPRWYLPLRLGHQA